MVGAYATPPDEPQQGETKSERTMATKNAKKTTTQTATVSKLQEAILKAEAELSKKRHEAAVKAAATKKANAQKEVRHEAAVKAAATKKVEAEKLSVAAHKAHDTRRILAALVAALEGKASNEDLEVLLSKLLGKVA